MSRWFGVILALGLSAHCFGEGNALQAWDFEHGDGGWKSMDKQGKISVTTDKDCVFAGAASLQFDYTQRIPAPGAAGDIPGVCGTELAQTFPDLKAISLGISTSTSIPMMCMLREKDGGNYVCPFFSNAGQWNEVTLSLDDFVLEEHSQDAAGKLDASQVVGIAFMDMTLYARQIKQATGLPVYVEPEGPHTLWLDDVKLLSAAPERKIAIAPEDGQAIYIDNCDGPGAEWLTVGGMNLKLSIQKEGAAAGQCLKVEYQSPAKCAFAIAHLIDGKKLVGAKGLALSLKADAKATLALVLEEKSGGRYVRLVQLTGGQDWTRVDSNFSGFKLEQTSHDPDGKLDPDDIKQLIIVDLALITGQPYANTIYVDEVAAAK